MRPFLFAFTLLMATQAPASYHRFWLGNKLAAMPTAAFMKGLNQKFFQETIRVGAGKGLQAYQVYIPKSATMPNELALVTYESEAKYNAIRASADGRKYGDLHWVYFDKSSKSTVSQIFDGSLSMDRAFELAPDFSDWQNGTSYVAVYRMESKDLDSLAKAFADLKTDANLNDAVLLLRDGFAYEIRSYKQAVRFNPLPLKVLETQKLANATFSPLTEVSFGDGINFKF